MATPTLLSTTSLKLVSSDKPGTYVVITCSPVGEPSMPDIVASTLPVNCPPPARPLKYTFVYASSKNPLPVIFMTFPRNSLFGLYPDIKGGYLMNIAFSPVTDPLAVSSTTSHAPYLPVPGGSLKFISVFELFFPNDTISGLRRFPR